MSIVSFPRSRSKGDLIDWIRSRSSGVRSKVKREDSWSTGNETVPFFQLIEGWVSLSQGYSRIVSCFLMLVLKNGMGWGGCPRVRILMTVLMISELMELSAFQAIIGLERGSVGRLCFLTRLEFIKFSMAPESTRAVIGILLSYVLSLVERIIDFQSTLQKSAYT